MYTKKMFYTGENWRKKSTNHTKLTYPALQYVLLLDTMDQGLPTYNRSKGIADFKQFLITNAEVSPADILCSDMEKFCRLP